jgi:HK97 gp10 family phage protein
VALKSRLPEIASRLAPAVDAAIHEGADIVSAGAKDRCPVLTGALRDAIHVEEGEVPGEVLVVAGNRKAFYGHMVEHGTVHSAPHPFLIPALEANRETIVSMVRAALHEAAS